MEYAHRKFRVGCEVSQSGGELEVFVGPFEGPDDVTPCLGDFCDGFFSFEYLKDALLVWLDRVAQAEYV